MRTIGEKYGVDQPMEALRKRLVSVIGPQEAELLLDKHREDLRRYQRAVRLHRAEELLRRIRTYRQDAWVVRRIATYEAMLANAQAYIDGTWAYPNRNLAPTTPDPARVDMKEDGDERTPGLDGDDHPADRPGPA